ncbi:MAG: hypothetical protein JO063_05270 [Pseudonocardiales bacterium]|nr:hypothetical protein [Pseudonocardiales bacterium]MBV9032154.1 hypothetical protein [Pseudonocardiales bacterium]MBW0009517.1 hypothetical protein [Pseudonocardiales bacterium]
MIAMTAYGSLRRAMGGGGARRDIPRWASGVLGEIAHNRTGVVGVRHPLGFVCLPVERTGEAGVCVHVWGDNLARASPTTSTMHAHSWDLVSYVLYGRVRNKIIDVTDAPDNAAYRVFEVRSSGDIDELRETPRLVRSEIRATELKTPGEMYSLPAGVFHTTVVHGDAATVALGNSRRGMMDLSLGEINRKTHRIRRQLCDRDETAHVARVATEWLARICIIDQEH